MNRSINFEDQVITRIRRGIANRNDTGTTVEICIYPR